MKRILALLGVLVFSSSQTLALCYKDQAATFPGPFYVAANAGIFSATFNQTYRDLTDTIQQNISESVQQRGYTGGVAIGYSKLVQSQYLVGAELSGNWDSHHAIYEAGASTAAFSDTIQILNHQDLTFVPGILLNPSLIAYIKLGISRASLRDSLSSPSGFDATMMQYGSNSTLVGFVGALGVKKFLTDKVAIFAEGNYHDYGKVSLSSFQNFTATYSHTAQVNLYAVALGLAYHF